MFQDKGRFVTAHLKHAARRHAMAETGVEEPGVMHAELAHHRQIG